MAKKKKSPAQNEAGIKIIAINRQARHEYIFEEFFEAGIALQGTEVKSLRNGRLSLVDAYAVVDDHGQVWLKGLNISKWTHASIFNHGGQNGQTRFGESDGGARIVEQLTMLNA